MGNLSLERILQATREELKKVDWALVLVPLVMSTPLIYAVPPAGLALYGLSYAYGTTSEYCEEKGWLPKLGCGGIPKP